MARPRTPTNVLKLRGADKKDPKRLRPREHEPKDDRVVGDPPEHLDDSEKACWLELRENAIKGVLLQSDRTALELTAYLLAKHRNEEKLTVQEMRALISLLGQMGFTPSERSRINVKNG